MKTSRKYVIAAAFLVVLAVVFGVFGTAAPPLAEDSSAITPQQESLPDSIGHFQNPPTYDSGWTDIRSKLGQHFSLRHDLNTTEVVVDVVGKMSLDPMGGTVAWTKTYGGTVADYAYSAVQTLDGGYALAGDTSSYGAGSRDFWLVKTDRDGQLQWSRTYGGTGADVARSVVQTLDGGYALAGYTASYGAGSYDFWLVKTDSVGAMLWNQTYGGTSTDYAVSVIQIDGGYALAGYTGSYGAGLTDFWLVKTDSAGTMLWSQTYGGANNEFAYSVVQSDDGGYALAGTTNSYGAGLNDFWLVKTDKYGTMEWSQTYGGKDYDYAMSMVPTDEGGYALAGYTESYGAGLNDFWLVKTDDSGAMLWSQTYGGTGNDYGYSLVQTDDGGFALTGRTNSFGAGGYDFWLVKTDSAGTMLWNRTYGGTVAEYGYSLVQAADGGFALAGYTSSFGAGGYDFWLVKVNGEMNVEHKRNYSETDLVAGWSRIYGGPSEEWGRSLVKTSDGGYAMVGPTGSYGAGSYDFWLVKTDAYGNMQWSKAYGGADTDYPYSVVQTSDGGYAIAGYTESYGAGWLDVWLVKTDSAGTMLWSQTYGGASYDYGFSVIQTSDGGYAIAGETAVAPGYNAWLIKTNSAGTMLWSQTYGATGADDWAYSVVQTSDGGYALAGGTESYGAGASDFWLVKTDSAGTMEWNRTYGGASYDCGYSMVQIGDGGYALAGYTNSFGAGGYDFWLVKTDAAGTMEWNRTYGGAGAEYGYSLVQTSDGGYALGGRTDSYGAGDYDIWLVKTDASGNMLWSQTYGGAELDEATSVVQTEDGGYALAGNTYSYGVGMDFWLVKTDVEIGLALTRLTTNSIAFYRGKTDPYWNYVRVRMWLIQEPSWIYGDINMDGIVDAKDLYIVGRNYGQTFSLLSLSGIVAVAGIHTVKKRKQNKRTSDIS